MLHAARTALACRAPGPLVALGAGVGRECSLASACPALSLAKCVGAVVFPRPLPSLVSRPRTAVPWQRGLTLSPGKWGLSPGTRRLGPGWLGHEQPQP